MKSKLGWHPDLETQANCGFTWVARLHPVPARDGIFYASTYVRLHSRKLRVREASSRKSAEDARRELKRRIAAELEAGEPIGVINQRTSLSDLFVAWLPTKIAEDRIGERTVTLYRDTWRLHGNQQLGELLIELLIRELTTSRADAPEGVAAVVGDLYADHPVAHVQPGGPVHRCGRRSHPTRSCGG